MSPRPYGKQQSRLRKGRATEADGLGRRCAVTLEPAPTTENAATVSSSTWGHVNAAEGHAAVHAITINWNAPFAWVTAFLDEKSKEPAAAKATGERPAG